jgi:hypothetical protein
MDGKGSFAFPDSGNDIVEGSITWLFPRYITHSTEFPHIKFRLNVLR